MKRQETIPPVSPDGSLYMPEEHGTASAVAANGTPSLPLPDVGHVDYNLHPLKVAGLDHYIEQPAWEVRFRIS